MALEAQLCPQCGATVTFAEMQTSATCPYCGTTVAKTEPQEVLKVNDLKELSEADNQKLKNLVLDGRRTDAIYFIRHYTGLGVCGGLSAPLLFWWAFSFFYLQSTWQQLQVSLSRRRGTAVPGRLQKVVPLKPATDQPGAPVTTRLVVEVPAAAGQPPSVVEVALDLPPATADGLKPGSHIEVVTSGPAFTYIPTPLKVLG